MSLRGFTRYALRLSIYVCLVTGPAHLPAASFLRGDLLLMQFLFVSGTPPAAPYPDCGADPTGDFLDCATERCRF